MRIPLGRVRRHSRTCRHTVTGSPVVLIYGYPSAGTRGRRGTCQRRSRPDRRPGHESARPLIQTGASAPSSGSQRKTKAEQMPEQTSTAAPATAADVIRPPLTTVEQQAHVAAAAYLMKHAGTTALTVVDPQTGQPGHHHRGGHRPRGRRRKRREQHPDLWVDDRPADRHHDYDKRPRRGQAHDEGSFPAPAGHRRRWPGRHHRRHRRVPRPARNRGFPATSLNGSGPRADCPGRRRRRSDSDRAQGCC